MDKYFLLTFIEYGHDGFRHFRHAWFETEDGLRAFVNKHEKIEVDLAIEILSCREIGIGSEPRSVR